MAISGLLCCVSVSLAALTVSPDRLLADQGAGASSNSAEASPDLLGLSGTQIYGAPLTTDYAYAYRRQKITADISARSFDALARAHLSDHERVVDRYLSYLKTLWLGGNAAEQSVKVSLPDNGAARPEPVHGAAQDVYNAIRNTTLFRVLSTFPKGANLGVRGGLASPEALLKEFHAHPNLYFSRTARAVGFFVTPPASFQRADSFALKEILSALVVPAAQSTTVFTGGLPPYAAPAPTSPDAGATPGADTPERASLDRDGWNRASLASYNAAVSAFWLFDPVWRRTVELTISAAYEQGLNYLEMRMPVGVRYTLEGAHSGAPAPAADAPSSGWVPNSTLPNSFGQRLVDPSGGTDLEIIRAAQRQFGGGLRAKQASVRTASAGLTDEGWSGVGVRVVSTISLGSNSDAKILARLHAFRDLRRGCALSPKAITAASTSSASATAAASDECAHGDNSDMLVGMEFCGDESQSRPLSSMFPLFQALSKEFGSALAKEFPLVVCAGESAAPVDAPTESTLSSSVHSTATDNLVDALLLNARRVTNPLMLSANPRLLSTFAKERIPIEISPVVSVELAFAPASAVHPFLAMAASDANLVLTSDTAALFGHGDATFDWVLAFTRWGLSLPGLKTLAQNSIRAALLTEREKWTLLDAWEVRWNAWIGTIVREACSVFPNHMYIASLNANNPSDGALPPLPRVTIQAGGAALASAPETAGPLLPEPDLRSVHPASGPVAGGYPVLLRGTTLDAAICSVFVCKFGRRESPALGEYRGRNGLSCIAPASPSSASQTNIIPTALAPADGLALQAGAGLAHSASDDGTVDWDASTRNVDASSVSVYLRWSSDGGRSYYNSVNVTFTYVDIPVDPDSTGTGQSTWERYQVVFVSCIVAAILLAGAAVAWRCLRKPQTTSERINININSDTGNGSSASDAIYVETAMGTPRFDTEASYRQRGIDFSRGGMPYDAYADIPIQEQLAGDVSSDHESSGSGVRLDRAGSRAGGSFRALRGYGSGDARAERVL